MRKALADAGPEEQLVESLVPMWDEERQRSGGELPTAPPLPPRNPGPLCKTVEDVRAQFQVSEYVSLSPAGCKTGCYPRLRTTYKDVLTSAKRHKTTHKGVLTSAKRPKTTHKDGSKSILAVMPIDK